ncbi:hypothetical protein AAG906_004228 [Vitis piasezkii]
MMMMIGVASVQGLIDLVVAGISLMICLGIFAFIASILCSAAFFHHAKELAPLIPTPSRPPPKCHSCHHCTMTVAKTKTDEVASPISLPLLFVSFSTTTTVAGHPKHPSSFNCDHPQSTTTNRACALLVYCNLEKKRKIIGREAFGLESSQFKQNSKNKDRIQLTTPRSPFQVTSYALLCQ